MNQKQIVNLIPIARQVSQSLLDNIQFKHVSIVMSGKSIVAIGTNGGKTHTLAHKYGYRYNRIHSELDAFTKIRYRDGHFVLVNFRFNNDGELRNSRPCKYCMPWVVEFFPEIWYSTDKGMKKL